MKNKENCIVFGLLILFTDLDQLESNVRINNVDSDGSWRSWKGEL